MLADSICDIIELVVAFSFLFFDHPIIKSQPPHHDIKHERNREEMLT